MTHPLFDLTGKRALITGSGQGIGLSLAMGLASAGARVILNGRSAARLADAAAMLRSEGYDPDLLPFDVTDHKIITAIITEKGIAYPPYENSLKKFFE